jgi:hypothetical protein
VGAAKRADQPAGRGKLLFTVSELLKEELPQNPFCFQMHSTMRALVTLVSLLFLGVQAQHEWTYSGKLPAPAGLPRSLPPEKGASITS